MLDADVLIALTVEELSTTCVRRAGWLMSSALPYAQTRRVRLAQARDLTPDVFELTPRRWQGRVGGR